MVDSAGLLIPPNRDRANTELPGGANTLTDATDFHAATMKLDSDENQNMFSPEAALSESRSKPQLPADENMAGRPTIGEGPGGTLDVINEKNSEVDGDKTRLEENSNQSNANIIVEGADGEGEGESQNQDNQKDQDELERESKTTEANQQDSNAE